jgi:hypothetical protein
MAPRKKKTEVLDMPGTIGSAKIVLPAVPVVVKGSHLTVTTFPDGSTKLEWDDAALLKEVQDAILSVELAATKPAVREKVSTRKKKDSNV